LNETAQIDIVPDLRHSGRDFSRQMSLGQDKAFIRALKDICFPKHPCVHQVLPRFPINGWFDGMPWH
jgi:hypothetical protein